MADPGWVPTDDLSGQTPWIRGKEREMGEATYYMKMRFKTREAAIKALPLISEFIAEGQEAEEFWQSHRGMEPGKFWPIFQSEFPKVYSYLGMLAGGDNNNALAGWLDFGSVGYNEDGPVPTLDPVAAEIRFYAMVWHFADWSQFANYIQHYFKCRVSWMSDEHIEPFDLL